MAERVMWFTSEPTEEVLEVCYREALKSGMINVAYAHTVHLGAEADINSTQMANLSTFKLGQGGTSRDINWVPVTEYDETNELIGLVHSLKRSETESSRVMKWIQAGIDLVASHTNQKSEAQKIIEEIIELAKQHPEIQAPKSEVYLYVWECGGQQVFHHILPAFLTSKSMFFLIFDARKALHEQCLSVSHHQDHATEQVLEQSTVELLLQWMSCIDANKSANESTTEIPEYPRILLVGTHGSDPTVQANKENILQRLYTEYKDKEYAHLVREKGVIIDNTTAGEGENADPGYRKIVNDFACSNEMKVDTPLTWVLFKKVLCKMAKNKPYFTLEEVIAVAEACTIPKDSVPCVLKFYHNFSVFLHYDKIPSLRSIVIVDPQWLIKQIAKLLAPEHFEKMRESRLWDVVQKHGILVEEFYTEIWKASTEDKFDSNLSPQSIVDLLEQLLIVASVNTHGKVHNLKGREYFVPCLLPATETGAFLDPPFYDKRAAPLHLVFPDIRYLPRGFFIRLATTLSQEQDYDIAFGHGIYSNRVSFIMGQSGSKIDTLTITECKHSIQIELVREKPRESGNLIFSDLCQRVIATIQRCFTYQVSQWFPGIKMALAFSCDHCKIRSPCTPEHLVLLKSEYTTKSGLRCQEDKIYEQNQIQKNWLKIAKPHGSTDSISDSEIKYIAKELQKHLHKFNDIKDALEMTTHKTKDPVILIERWIKEMEQIGVPPRPYLIHHLECIDMHEVAEKIKYLELVEKGESSSYTSYSRPEEQRSAPSQVLTMKDHRAVTVQLKNLTKPDLIGLGTTLGLYYPRFQKMRGESLSDEMVAAWLREDDSVTKASGPPTWSSLAAAVDAIGLTGVASWIKKNSSQFLSMADHYVVTQELKDLNQEELMVVGIKLGLYYSHLQNMKDLPADIVAAWLREDDVVTEVSGPPTWASLAEALCHTGIASRIREKYLPDKKETV